MGSSRSKMMLGGFEYIHGLPKNNGDLRLFSIYLAICDHKVNTKNNHDRSQRNMYFYDRGRIAAGYSEIGLQLFFISRLFMVRFSNSFPQNDGNTLLNKMSDKAQIYLLFSSW